MWQRNCRASLPRSMLLLIHTLQEITGNGKTAIARVMDECPTCGSRDLDMSRSLFHYFASESDGVFDMEWMWRDEGGAPPAPAAIEAAPSPYSMPEASPLSAKSETPELSTQTPSQGGAELSVSSFYPCVLFFPSLLHVIGRFQRHEAFPGRQKLLPLSCLTQKSRIREQRLSNQLPLPFPSTRPSTKAASKLTSLHPLLPIQLSVPPPQRQPPPFQPRLPRPHESCQQQKYWRPPPPVPPLRRTGTLGLLATDRSRHRFDCSGACVWGLWGLFLPWDCEFVIRMDEDFVMDLY